MVRTPETYQGRPGDAMRDWHPVAFIEFRDLGAWFEPSEYLN